MKNNVGAGVVADRGKRAALLLLVLYLAGACSSSGGTNEPSGSRGSAGDQPDGSSAARADALPASDLGPLLATVLPLESGPLTSTLKVVDQARDQLLERCMKARGFAYLAPVLSSGGPPPEERFGDYLGITNLSNAEQYGYHASSKALEEVTRRESQARAQVADPPSPEYLAALTGSKDSTASAPRGCVDEVEVQLGNGGGTDPSNAIGGLIQQSISTVLQSPAYLAALDRWTGCMRDAGIDPPAAPFDLIPKYGREPVTSAEEIGVATTDVTCKASSGLVVTWMNELGTAQKALAEENAVVIDEVRQAEQRLLDQAEQLLASS